MMTRIPGTPITYHSVPDTAPENMRLLHTLCTKLRSEKPYFGHMSFVVHSPDQVPYVEIHLYDNAGGKYIDGMMLSIHTSQLGNEILLTANLEDFYQQYIQMTVNQRLDDAEKEYNEILAASAVKT